MYMFSLIIGFNIIRPKPFITNLASNWVVRTRGIFDFLAMCILKFLGKLEQFDFAESCFELRKPFLLTRFHYLLTRFLFMLTRFVSCLIDLYLCLLDFKNHQLTTNVNLCYRYNILLLKMLI